MKMNLIKLVAFFFITLLKVNAFSQEVTKNNFSAMGWEKAQVNTSTPPGSMNIRTPATDFVFITCGPNNPAKPGLKRGAAYMSFPKETADPSLPQPTKDKSLNRVLLSSKSFNGILLRDITELKYSTYTEKTDANTSGASGKPKQPVTAPVLLLQIDLYGDGSRIENINFEPFLQQQNITPAGIVQGQKVETGLWQEWDALKGQWKFIKRNPADSDPIKNIEGLKPWTFFIDNFSAANIINTDFMESNGGPGLRFLLRPEDFTDYRGYVDALTLFNRAIDQKSFTYDFVSTEKCKTTGPFITKEMILYFILSGLAIWGCFIIFRNYKRKQRITSIK